MSNAFQGAFNSRIVRMGVSLAVMFIFILTMGGMSVLSGNASTTLDAIIASIYDFREIIGLGFAVAIISLVT